MICARSCVPQTISTSPVARTRSGSICAKQPHAAMTARGLSRRSLWNARIFLWSETDVTVQVLMMTASAPLSTISCPRSAASCESACVSNRLTLQPSVKKANFMPYSSSFLLLFIVAQTRERVKSAARLRTAEADCYIFVNRRICNPSAVHFSGITFRIPSGLSRKTGRKRLLLRF